MLSKLLAVLLLCAPLSLLAKVHQPIPEAILTAKTVYVLNKSGTQKIGDVVFDDLTKWARFKIVTNRSEADLILTFENTPYLVMTVTTPSSDDPLFQVTPGRHYTWAAVANDCINSFKKRVENN